jgi:hypothetical protein
LLKESIGKIETEHLTFAWIGRPTLPDPQSDPQSASLRFASRAASRAASPRLPQRQTANSVRTASTCALCARRGRIASCGRASPMSGLLACQHAAVLADGHMAVVLPLPLPLCHHPGRQAGRRLDPTCYHLDSCLLEWKEWAGRIPAILCRYAHIN